MTSVPQAGPLLANVNFPHHLRALPEAELVNFAAELRDYIIEHVSIYGGQRRAARGGAVGQSLGICRQGGFAEAEALSDTLRYLPS